MEKLKKIFKNFYILYKNIVTIDYKFMHMKQSVLYESEMRRLSYITNTSLESGISSTKYCDANITVSLTTYGRRILTVHSTIESLMQQTIKPNRIILWLDNGFKGTFLPSMLLKLQKRGLEILYCEDIRSYKKLIPTLKMVPDDAIITCDDDVIYSPDMIENLIKDYIADPSKKIVYANVCHKITFNKQGKLNLYRNWIHNTSDNNISELIFPVGVGGVLYPPHSLDIEVLNEKAFTSLAPYGDDIWFKFMSLRNGYACKKVITPTANGYDFLENIDMRDCGLAQINNLQNKNDEQIENVIKEYNIILSK